MNWFLLAFISAIFSAAAAVSEKKTLFSLRALDFSFIVSIVTLLFSIPFFIVMEYHNIISISILILFLKTILSAVAFLYVMIAIKSLEISEALPLLALTPAFVAITGVIFINDALTSLEWLGIFLMVAGTYILEIKKRSKNILEPFKEVFSSTKYLNILIALILFTITSLLDRVLLKKYNLPPYTFMAFQQLFYALIFTVVVLTRYKNISKPVKDLNKKLFFLIILISVFTVIYRYTQIEATKLAPVALVLSVKRISVLMAIIFGGKLFKEANLFRRVAAAVIILIGAAILMNQ